MLQVKYYSKDTESGEVISSKILEIDEAKNLWNSLLQKGYFEKKEGVLTNGVYRMVFTYTGGFNPNITHAPSLMEKINTRGGLK